MHFTRRSVCTTAWIDRANIASNVRHAFRNKRPIRSRSIYASRREEQPTASWAYLLAKQIIMQVMIYRYSKSKYFVTMSDGNFSDDMRPSGIRPWSLSLIML